MIKNIVLVMLLAVILLFLLSNCALMTHVPVVSVTYSASFTSLTLNVDENSECSLYKYKLRDISWGYEISKESTDSSITFSNLNPGNDYEAVVYCGKDEPKYCVYVEKITTPRNNDTIPPKILSNSVNTSKAVAVVEDIPSGVESVQIRFVDNLEIPTTLTYDLKYNFITGQWITIYSLPHKGAWKYSLIVEDKSKNISEATGTINF